jgi:hypothetical protein
VEIGDRKGRRLRVELARPAESGAHFEVVQGD